MTSSYLLKKRFENNELRVADASLPLGGWEDHYITPGGTHECHPDFIAHPVNGKYGFMICTRKNRDSDRHLSLSADDVNDYDKYAVDLYTPKNKNPRVLQQPYSLDQRRMPYESHHITDDYVRLPFKYNGTGVKVNNTPGSGSPYSEFGFSYTPYPPYKYDITRLQQPYEIWKKSREYVGVLDDTTAKHLDENYRDRNV
ncbi:MAG TPA: hypothetical protein VLE02_01905 [Nitrosarchaeum sp.]|nr:hypothetical protein [Nitrosarchaeum sp.]